MKFDGILEPLEHQKTKVTLGYSLISSNSVSEQQRTKPGNGGQKPSTQFLIGDNEWVEGWKWYDAIKARKEGTATKEQIEILDRGHWKE